MKELERDKSIGAIGSNYNRITEKGNIDYTSNFALGHEEIVEKMPDQFDVVGSGLMIRKEVYDTIGGYNEFFDRIGAEDYYWIYLISEKYNIKNIEIPLYSYRHNVNSVAGNLSDSPKKLFSGKIIEHLILQRKNIGTDDLDSGHEHLVNKLLDSYANPFIENKSYFYIKLATKYFYEGQKKRALKLAFKSILCNPFSINRFRDFIYFLKY